MVSVDKDTIAFIKSNLESFSIDPASSLVDVKASNFNRPMFHSGNRPGAAILLEYRDPANRTQIKNIWAKRMSYPEQAYNEMAYIYEKMKSSSLNIKMPIPFCCDKERGIIFISHVSGSNLRVLTLKHLLFGPMPFWLRRIYFDIGKWLNDYHVMMSPTQKVPFINILNELIESLKNDKHFNADEKSMLHKHLMMIQREINDH